jgi:hypothetical protein
MLNFIGSATDWNQPENATEPLARGQPIPLEIETSIDE